MVVLLLRESETERETKRTNYTRSDRERKWGREIKKYKRSWFPKQDQQRNPPILSIDHMKAIDKIEFPFPLEIFFRPIISDSSQLHPDLSFCATDPWSSDKKIEVESTRRRTFLGAATFRRRGRQRTEQNGGITIGHVRPGASETRGPEVLLHPEQEAASREQVLTSLACPISFYKTRQLIPA